jgi:type II secretory pathway pseudopilin PulG
VVTLLAILDLLAAGFCLLIMVGGAIALLSGGEKGIGFGLVVVWLYAVIGLLSMIAGIGLLGLKSHGRVAQMVLAGIGLLAIPLGTLVSILVLLYFSKPGVRVLFSGRPPAELDPQEVAAVAAVRGQSGPLVAVLAVGVLLCCVAGVGVVAAVAIPSLLRARVAANEAAAIADIRSVLAAESQYAGANGGLFDRLECLAAPVRCIPGYPAAGPSFLQGEQASTSARRGYTFTFHAGARPAALNGARSSGSSLSSFAYVAAPLQQGQTGARSFCGDASGRVCVIGAGAPAPVDGACPMPCQVLQ